MQAREIGRGSHGSDAPVVGVVCLVVHNELVIHKVEAVGPGLEGVVHHLMNWSRGDNEGRDTGRNADSRKDIK